MFDSSVFKRRLWISLGLVAFLVFAGVALMLWSNEKGGEYASRASVAIRQRALASEIQFLLLSVSGISSPDDSMLNAVSEHLVKWEKAQRDLMNGTEMYGQQAENSREVQALLFEAGESFGVIRDRMHEWLELKSFPEGSATMLSLEFREYSTDMDRVAARWMDEDLIAKKKLRTYALAMGGMSLLVFLLMLRFVVRPGVRKLEEAADEIQRVETDLQQANLVKTEFMANMSHEIRTPINGVIGMTEVLASTGLSAEQRDYVRSIQSSATNLLDLVNDILDYSMIESGKLEIHKERFVLSDCMDQVTDIMKPMANQKKLELITDIDPELPIELLQDERRIRQVLINLVNNAVKFTDHGEVVVRAELLSSEGGFVHVRFAITDTGIGIDPDKIPLLFRSFSQADGSVSRKYGGSGLGLAICKSLVSEMGGKIWVESNPGRGSTFFFTIVAETSGETQSARIKSLNGMKALVVDDNKTNLKILVRQLSNWGIQATPFNSPDLVTEIIPDLRKFDFCILDMQMPEIDGAALAAKIRKHHSITELPILVLSSVGQHLVDAKGDLYNAYLTKPVRQSRLLDAIAEVMKSHSEDRNQHEGGHFAGHFGHSKLKVLIAHDNELTRAVTEKTLQMMGYQFEVAHSGEEMLEQTRKEDYDLIIMDIHVPGIGGIEAMRRMRRFKQGDEIPVVIGIVENEQADRSTCIKAGMSDVVSRPLNTEELQRKIHYWLEESTTDPA